MKGNPELHTDWPRGIAISDQWIALGLDGLGFYARLVDLSAQNQTQGFLSNDAVRIAASDLTSWRRRSLVQRLVAQDFLVVVDSGWMIVKWAEHGDAE